MGTLVTTELMTDATGQSIATALGTIGATSVGNLAALTTTDKSSLVGAINELKSGLTSVDNLNHINISFNATDVQDYLKKVIDTVNNEYPVGTTINIYGAWLGACMFLMQVSRTSSNQTIVSAIPQPGNYGVNKMWIGMKEDSTYSYSTIDMVIVN